MRKPKLTKEATKKHGSESWTLVRLVAPLWNPDVEPPVRMHAIMVLGHDGHIVGSELVQPDAPDTEILTVLAQAIKQPQHGRVRKPTEVKVEDERFVALLEPFLASAAPGCVVSTTDWSVEADEVFAAMRERLNTRVPRESFERAGVSPTLMREYLTSMLALEPLAPWTKAVEDQAIAFSIPSLHVTDATIRVIGSDGQGLLVQEEDDPAALLEFESQRGREREAFKVGMLSTHFVALLRGSNEMVHELRESGLIKNEARVPMPAALGPDVCPRLLTKRDIILLTAAARVVERLFNTQADLFAPESERRFKERLEMTIGGEELSVYITVPHPLFSWDHLPEEEDDGVDFGEADTEKKLTPEEEAIVRDFLPSIEERGEDFSLCAERIVVELSHYTRHTGATFADWTLGELERFVMEDAFNFLDEGIEHVPEVIIALATWLRAERKPKLDAQAIEKRMRKLKPRFEERLASRSSRLLA